MMETLVLKFKSKKNYRLVKELASQLEKGSDSSLKEKKGISSKRNLEKEVVGNYFENKSREELIRELPKSKLTDDDIRAMGGMLKGQLISKEHIRNVAWKKRDW